MTTPNNDPDETPPPTRPLEAPDETRAFADDTPEIPDTAGETPGEAEFTTPSQLGVLSLDEPTPTATTPAATSVLTADDPGHPPTATAPAEPGAPGAALPPSSISTDSNVRTAEPGPPMRMRTVVLGMVLLVIAGAVLVGALTDVSVDAGAIVLALMIGAGVLLIAGARRP